MGIIMFIVYGFTGILLYNAYIFMQRKYLLKDFPGPVAFPVVGNLYDLRAYSIIQYIRECSKIYGKVFAFWAGSSPTLVVTDPALARQVLSNTVLFVKGPDYTDKFGIVFGDGLVTSTGDKHKKDRNCLGKYFLQTNINSYIPMFADETKRMIDEFIEPVLSQDINMENFFHQLSLRIFGKFSLSIDYGSSELQKVAENINSAVKFGSHVVGQHIIMSLPMWSFLPRIRKLRKVVQYIDDHLDNVINERIAHMRTGRHWIGSCGRSHDYNDILDVLLANAQPRKALKHHLRTLLSAGHDTTAFFGCYMAYLLAQHSDVQTKVKAEISTVLGEGNTTITGDNLKQLAYCRMVIQETLRLYTIIPFVNRVAANDYVWIDDGGVSRTIPKGTVLLIGLSNMNRDEDNWNNPNSFVPERFDTCKGHCSAKHGYMPFGYGSRTCIGNNLAITEGVIVLVHLMKRYHLLPVKSFKPKIIAGISLVSKNGVRIRIERDQNYVGTLPLKQPGPIRRRP